MCAQRMVSISMDSGKRKKNKNGGGKKNNTGKKLVEVEENWRLMYCQLTPDTWTEAQGEEMFTMVKFVIHGRCDKEKDAVTIHHLATLMKYNSVTTEDRKAIDERMAQVALHGKLADSIVFIANPAKDIERFAKGYADDTIPMAEVIGFISYHHDKKEGIIHIGHVFITEEKRRRGVGRTAMNELIKKVCYTEVPQRIPLIITDVDEDAKGALQFLFMCGFVFTRQPGQEGMKAMTFEEAETAGIEMSLKLPNKFKTSTEMALDERYKLLFNEHTKTWRLTLSVADHCYHCRVEVPTDALQRCGKCKACYYCGPTCQEKNNIKGDEASHRLVCKVDRF